MKRQLADRARQAEALEKQLLESRNNDGGIDDVVVTNAKEIRICMKGRTIQAPPPSDPIHSTGIGSRTPTTPKINKPTNSNLNVEGTVTSVSSSSTSSATLGDGTSTKPETPTSLLTVVENQDHSSSPSITNEESLNHRPTKVPRFHKERSSTPLTVSDDKSFSTDIPTTAISASTTSQPLQAQLSSRRLSLPVDHPQLTTSNDLMDTTGSNNNDDDNSSSQQSAFYLKYQNRALATELKSYQHSMTELLQERKLRRTHCYGIFQTLQQLIRIWDTIERKIISTKNLHRLSGIISTDRAAVTAPYNNVDNVVLNSIDIASTGTDDSVEWTRQLQNALLALGKCTIPVDPSRRIHNTNKNEDVDVDAMVASTSYATTIDNDNHFDLHLMNESVTHLSSRAKILQEWLQAILQSQRPNDDITDGTTLDNNDESGPTTIQQHQQQITELLARCATLEGQVTELVTCRTDLIRRERRLRRNIYRMAADLISPEQVVKSSMMRPDDVTSDHDSSNDVDDIESAVQKEKQELLMLKKDHQELLDTIRATRESANSDNTNDFIENHHMSHLLSKQIEEYQAKVTTLDESLTIAERSIHELNINIKEKEDKVTALSQRQLSDGDRLKLESLPSTLLQLQQSQQRNIELQSKLSTTEQMWSQTLGNEKACMHSVSDLIQKFNKRWVELTTIAFTTHHDVDASTAIDKDVTSDDTIASSTGESMLPSATKEMPDEHPQIFMSKQIHALQQKLHQALENVRQAESSRENLKIAISMNTTLQSKLDEMKAKYSAIQNARSSASNHGSSIVGLSTVASKSTTGTEMKKKKKNGVLSKSDDDTISAGVVTDTTGTSTSLSADKDDKPLTTSITTGSTASRPSTTSSSSSEKLRRDNRKVRKELDAMTNNYTTMMTTNVRLLKQISEKDEMNAKSLSTILHLKSTTEKLIEERDHLEIQMKNASQLALAARLATNAKDRVAEEMMKEKKNLDVRRMTLEEQLATTQTELQSISIEMANASSIIATKDVEISNVMVRINHLVEENEQRREEIRRLNNTVSRAEREAREANDKLSDMVAKSEKDTNSDSQNDYNNVRSSSSSFTVEQLQTQVSVLKNRLACPVCHYRDKECIIIRCRHMHCKQCVDERVSNRSRKCPTCNVKFAENEVETIFLS